MRTGSFRLAVSGVLLLLAPITWGLTVAPMSLPELVYRADTVVLGRVTHQDAGRCKISVTEVLLGNVPQEISVISPNNGMIGHKYALGEENIFFIESKSGSLAMVHPSFFQPATNLANVRAVVAMKTSPDKFIRTATASPPPDFIEMLGWHFQDKIIVDGVTQQSAADYLLHALTSVDNETPIRAMDALQKMGRKDFAAVIPLLEHSDVAVRTHAAKLLAWAPDSTAVFPLCKALDKLQLEGRNVTGLSSLESAIGWALVQIGDSRAIPALERTVKSGRYFSGAANALGRLGDKPSFDVLIALLTPSFSGSALLELRLPASGAIDALKSLVQRSNKRVELWMNDVRKESSLSVAHREDWLNWWQQNKAEFKIVRTDRQATALRIHRLLLEWERTRVLIGQEDINLHGQLGPPTEKTDTSRTYRLETETGGYEWTMTVKAGKVVAFQKRAFP
jgi:hypothetical protein